uniref:Uncharacterized protein n=1 Tax=Propithecus coquereli TaxID=379532 RepID=A0A2K6FTH7_PROCO
RAASGGLAGSSPGPTPLPFLGNYLQLNTEQIYDSLMKISERYGPVFTVHLGPRRVVVLCGYDAVKEALVDQAEEFSGRGEQATFDRLFKGYASRRRRASSLRHSEARFPSQTGISPPSSLSPSNSHLSLNPPHPAGAIIDPTFFLSRTVSDVIKPIVFGDRFDYENKELLSLLRMMKGSLAFTATSTGQLYEMFYSVMNHLPGPQQQVFKELQGLEDFIAKKVEHNQRTLDPNSPRDFIDSFLIRMQEEKKNPNTAFCMKNLVLTTLNLFFAGTETFSMTLRYGFLLLMKHPDVEAKVHEEIDRDQAKMSYTEAVIHEI